MPRTAFRMLGDDGVDGGYGSEVRDETRGGGLEGAGAEAGEFGDECFSTCEGHKS